MHSSRVADWSVKGKRNPANEHPAMKFTIVIPDWEEVPLLRKTGFQDDAGPTEEGRGRGGEGRGEEWRGNRISFETSPPDCRWISFHF